MTKKLRVSALLLVASLSGASLADPAAPRNQDDLFWANVQLSEGVQLDQARPMPRGATQVAQPQAEDWFALERQKTEGYTADAAVQPMPRLVGRVAEALARPVSR
jgi:hypothetical protein